VVGHQWWWEFRYPQYTTRNPVTNRVDTLVTANELYLPKGKTVNFALRTDDVLHSFWIPRLGGKRDLIANHTNYLWFTPDSVDLTVLNGSCNEYCGASHANMKFRTFVVDTAQFASWVAGSSARRLHARPAAAATRRRCRARLAAAPGRRDARRCPRDRPAHGRRQAAPWRGQRWARRARAPCPAHHPGGTRAQSGGYYFPYDSMPEYASPSTPVPTDVGSTPSARRPARRASIPIKGGCIAAT
jgi:cytochrome c oxidase subunit 2